MPVTKEITLYRFSELSEKLQEKLIERRAQSNQEIYELEPDCIWEAWCSPESDEKDHDPQAKTGYIRQRDYDINPRDIKYSLGNYNGGDYVAFEARVRDLKKLARRVLKPETFKVLNTWHRKFHFHRGVAKVWDADITFKISTQGNNYLRMEVEWDWYSWPNLPDNADPPRELLGELCEALKDDVERLACDMEKWAMAELEDQGSEERAREELENGSELYDEDGDFVEHQTN